MLETNALVISIKLGIKLIISPYTLLFTYSFCGNGPMSL